MINIAPLQEMYGQKGVEAAKTAVGGDLSQLTYKKTIAPTPVAIKTDGPVPSSAITSGTTKDDVYRKRNDMAANQDAATEFSSYLQSMGSTSTDANALSRLMWPQTDLNTASAQASESYRNMLSSAGSEMNSMYGKSSADSYNQYTEDAGLQDQMKLLQESNLRRAELEGQKKRLRPATETQPGMTRVRAEAYLTPEERNLDAAIASEALVQAALMGNVQMIQNNAKTLVDLETADDRRDISILENRISMEKARVESLQGEEKAQADKQLAVANIMLDDRKRMLDQKQNDVDAKQKFALEYLKATGDAAGAAAIMSSGSYGDAVRNYGSKMGPGAAEGTADMKNFLFAKEQGYDGTFADWVMMLKGSTPSPSYKGMSLEMDMEKMTQLEAIGVTTGDVIEVQNLLNQGYDMAQIAKISGMPNEIYIELANLVGESRLTN